MTQKIDLHIHSCFSDGELTPKEIVNEAVQKNINIISITDHDTFDAYTPEFYEYCNKMKIRIINGVEISTKYNGAGVHILGYRFDIKNKVLKDKLYEIRNSRHVYLKEVSVKLAELGYVVNIDELDKIDAVTKAHIALDVIDNSLNKKILIDKFGHIPNKGEFIEAVMAIGCPGFVKRTMITPDDAAKLIRQAGGKVVVAHPVACIHENRLTRDEVINMIDEIKPDGIEANYIYINKFGEIINEIEFWNEFAKCRGLHVTIGSDFHKHEIGRHDIGEVNKYIEFDDRRLDEIINFLNKK